MEPKLLSTLIYKNIIKTIYWGEVESKAVMNTQGLKELMEQIRFNDFPLYLSLVYVSSQPIFEKLQVYLKKINITNMNTNYRIRNRIPDLGFSHTYCCV